MMSDSEKLDLIISMLKQMRQPVTGGGAIANDSELDGKYGNPDVRLDPKQWSGASYIGKKFSDCPPDYLTATAEMFEMFAAKKKKGGEEDWKELKNASRARGWAKRNAAKAAASNSDDLGELPF